jgi:hypothetical protein
MLLMLKSIQRRACLLVPLLCHTTEGTHVHSTPSGGRPSYLAMPAFNLQFNRAARDDGGVDATGLVWMIGWSGNWQVSIGDKGR